MKKALAILLALALVASVSAQDEPALGFTGLAVAYTTVTEDGIYLTPYNEFSFYFSDGTWGLNATMLITTDFGPAATFRNYSIYVKLYDMLKITVGKVRMADYRLTPYVFNNLGVLAGLDRITGENIVFQLTGVPDLSFGVAVPLDEAVGDPAVYPDFTTTMNGTDIYASYNVAGIGKFYLGLINIADVSRYVKFGANITAVENLTAKLGFGYQESNMDIDASFGYDMAPIDFGLDAKVDLPNGGDLAYAAELKVGYAIDEMASASLYFYLDSDNYMIVTPYFIQGFDYGEIDIYAPIVIDAGTVSWSIDFDFILFY